MKKPLISIITVVYNGADTLEQTIKSVIKQTYDNIEYLIIDGGSTDGTLDIIKKYETHLSFWVSEPDKGLYDAMNKGIKKANGELIGIVNSDDWYELNNVETIVEAFLKNTTKTIFHGNAWHHFPEGSIKLKTFNSSKWKFLYYGTTYEHPTFFVTRKEYQEHLYNYKLKSLADYQFMLEAYLKNPNKFYYINKPLTNFRIGGISAKLTISQKLSEGYFARKNAGLSIFQNSLSYIFRFLIFSLKS